MTFGYTIPQPIQWKNRLLKVMGWPNVIRRLQAPRLMKMLGSTREEYVLDAGCGTGHFAFEIAKRARLCVGVDLNIIEHASELQNRLQSLRFVKADLNALPFKNNIFHKMLISSVLQMVEDERGVLKECYRVLRREGIVVLSVPVKYIWLKVLNRAKERLRCSFGAKGRGFYSIAEVMGLLLRTGFSPVDREFAPKLWGSFVYEIQLLLNYRFRLPSFSVWLFPLFCSIASVDLLSRSRDQRGDEILIKALKS